MQSTTECAIRVEDEQKLGTERPKKEDEATRRFRSVSSHQGNLLFSLRLVAVNRSLPWSFPPLPSSWLRLSLEADIRSPDRTSDDSFLSCLSKVERRNDCFVQKAVIFNSGGFGSWKEGPSKCPNINWP